MAGELLLSPEDWWRMQFGLGESVVPMPMPTVPPAAQPGSAVPPPAALPPDQTLTDIGRGSLYGGQTNLTPIGPEISKAKDPGIVGDLVSTILPDRRLSQYEAALLKGTLGTTGLGDRQTALIDWVPFLGQAVQGTEAVQRQDPTALAMAAIPGAAKGKAAIKAAAAELTPAVKTGEQILTGERPTPGIGHNMPPEPIAPVTPGPEAPSGRRAAITATNLRDMPLEQAIATARTEPHIIPQKDGSFVGAPYRMRSMQDLQQIRNEFDQAVDLGVSAGGEKWYERGRGVVSELTAGDPARGRTLAQELGVTSSQATPQTNLGFALQGHNAFMAGMPAEIVHTGDIARKINRALETGTDIPLGKKTEIFGINLDPNRPLSSTGTNDIWHARALGYTDKKGRPWDEALSPQQHTFMDAETVLAVDRANQTKLGGRSDWTAPEIQAAAWVGKKAQAIALEEGIPIGQALERAKAEYGQYLPQYTAYGTTDAPPGIGTGHLPEISGGSREVRQAYAEDPRSRFSRPTPESGGKPYDPYHRAVGLYQRPTQETTGIYQQAGGPLEVNPGEAAPAMVSMTGPSGKREIDPASLKLLQAAEALKAYGNVQNMAGISMLVPSNQATRLTSVQFPTGGKWTPEQVDALMRLGKQFQIPDVVHYGDVGAMTSWGGGGNAANIRKAVGSPEAPGPLAQQLADIVPGAVPTRTEVQSGYSPALDFSKAWAKGEGSGAATRQLKKSLTPDLIQKLDTPEIRADILGRMERDAQLGEQGMTVRQDVQNAREIIGRDGLAGLFKALKAGGVSLPVVLPYLMPYLRDQQEGS